MRKQRMLKLFAIFATLVLTIAACSSSDDDSEASPDSGGAAPSRGENDTFKIQTLLPTTGGLEDFGPGMRDAVQFAVDEQNKAGGVLGNDVVLEANADTATNPDTASSAADEIIADTSIVSTIGPAGSDQTAAILDKTTGAGLFVCSPSNTADSLTNRDNDGYYARTAPPDSLQGPVLSELIANDGHGSVSIMFRNDDYGKGLNDSLKENLEQSNITVDDEISIDPEGTDFAADVDQLVSAGSDANVLLMFPEEGAKILASMIEKGIGPADTPTYGSDGMRSDELGAQVDSGDPNVVDGMKGTAPGGDTSESFQQPFAEAFPDSADVTFAPQSYDCANIIALAAEKAQSVDPAQWKGEVENVTKAGAEQCATFAECLDRVKNGDDVEYVGAAGPYNLDSDGNPTTGTYEWWEYENAEPTTINTTTVGGTDGDATATPGATPEATPEATSEATPTN